MNWPRYIVEYGQAGAIVMMLACAVSTALLLRRFYRKPVAWISVLLTMVLVYQAGGFLLWAKTKVDPLKPVFGGANKAAPNLAFVSADGSEHRISEYHGKVVVVNLWATWCDSCRAEMPGLERLQEVYGKNGVVVVTISDEDPTLQSKLPGWTSMQVVRGHVDPDLKTSGLYVEAEVARPITHIIGRDGVLKDTLIGPHSYDFLSKQILPLLDEPR